MHAVRRAPPPASGMELRDKGSARHAMEAAYCLDVDSRVSAAVLLPRRIRCPTKGEFSTSFPFRGARKEQLP